jgi:hypothetical protein
MLAIQILKKEIDLSSLLAYNQLLTCTTCYSINLQTFKELFAPHFLGQRMQRYSLFSGRANILKKNS